MKTMIATNRTQKTVSIMTVMMMIFTMGYGQGMLMEGASKLIQSFIHKEATTEFVAITADYTTDTEEEKDSFRINAVLNVFDRNQQNLETSTVIASFTVKNVDVAYEAELETELWMETPLTEQIETVPAVESWMTESFTNNMEGAIEVESWMTVPLADHIESEIVTEEWMTTPLDNHFENEVTAENWMTQPLYENGSLEQPVETEEWMMIPLYASAK
ncbi:MAG: hypothetical protein P1P82_05335 [Bacteroidales bacterium]|nr:hypothetical protein [Bacteroidales bacterium]MDT8430863.1 hypothetical protein [Bacteroidales bacterium]